MRRDIGLQPDQPLSEAAAQVIRLRTEAVFDTADRIDLERPSGVHDSRVAIRRLRAALEIFAVCFPAEADGRLRAELGTLASALGERRDCDVQIDLLTALRAEVTASERRAIEALLRGLRREHRRASRRAEKALRRAKSDRLGDRLRELSA